MDDSIQAFNDYVAQNIDESIDGFLPEELENEFETCQEILEQFVSAAREALSNGYSQLAVYALLNTSLGLIGHTEVITILASYVTNKAVDEFVAEETDGIDE